MSRRTSTIPTDGCRGFTQYLKAHFGIVTLNGLRKLLTTVLSFVDHKNLTINQKIRVFSYKKKFTRIDFVTK